MHRVPDDAWYCPFCNRDRDHNVDGDGDGDGDGRGAIASASLETGAAESLAEETAASVENADVKIQPDLPSSSVDQDDADDLEHHDADDRIGDADAGDGGVDFLLS